MGLCLTNPMSCVSLTAWPSKRITTEIKVDRILFAISDISTTTNRSNIDSKNVKPIAQKTRELMLPANM